MQLRLEVPSTLPSDFPTVSQALNVFEILNNLIMGLDHVFIK